MVAAVLVAATAVAGAVAAIPHRASDAQLAAPPGVRVGVTANSLDFGTGAGREQTAARKAGAKWLREELRWGEVESRPGEFHWRRFDRVMTAAAHRRLHVLILLDTTPRWEGPSPVTIPPDASRFAEFTARAVKRYGPGGSFWRVHRALDARLAPRWFEIWNEPFLVQFSGGGPDPARYGRLAEAAARAGRQANPATRFLFAGEVGYRGPDGAARPWIRDLFAATPGLARVTDGIAVHPYSDGSPAAGRQGILTGFRRLTAIRDEVAKASGRVLPVWVTEVGWSTCTERPRCVSEAAQARFVRDLFGVLRAEPRGRVRAVFLYRLRDLRGSSSSDPRERFFGLLRANGSRKPAWRVLRGITRRGP